MTNDPDDKIKPHSEMDGVFDMTEKAEPMPRQPLFALGRDDWLTAAVTGIAILALVISIFLVWKHRSLQAEVTLMRAKVESQAKLIRAQEAQAFQARQDAIVAAPEPAPLPQVQTLTVTTQYTNMRSRPDGSTRILATLDVGDQVQVINRVGDWYQVLVGAELGFIFHSLLR